MKVKLLGDTDADQANGMLRAIPLPLKCLSNFWKSHKIPLINCKVELKFKWMNHCVLVSNFTDNLNANTDNIIFTIRDTKLYILVVTLSAKDNQRLSKLLKKGLERSVD